MKNLKPFAVMALAVFALLPTARAQDPSADGLRAELEAMFVSDQTLRLEARVVAEKFGQNSAENAALWEKQHAIDDANTKRLAEIVDKQGWPEQSKAGKKAATAAFLVVQHAELDQQKRFLPLLRDSVARGEAQPQNLALLEDRIKMREGKPQIYGSQIALDPATRKLSFHAIDDEINLDKRRAAVGLEPLSEYAKRFGFVYEPPKQ